MKGLRSDAAREPRRDPSSLDRQGVCVAAGFTEGLLHNRGVVFDLPDCRLVDTLGTSLSVQSEPQCTNLLGLDSSGSLLAFTVQQRVSFGPNAER